MGAKGDLGVTLDLDKVPCREESMSAYEMMLSESQERMLMVLKPEKEKEAEAIFRKWGLDFAVVGETTPTKRFVVRHGRRRHGGLCPSRSSATRRRSTSGPFVSAAKPEEIRAESVHAPVGTLEALEKLLEAPDLCSKRWVWEQYDHVILGNTVQRPGGDAAVVRVEDGPKGLALTTDVTPRYCEADPFEGGKQAVAECWRNITAVGAKPLACYRQSQLRQSRAARHYGAVRRLHPRNRRSVQSARLSGRVREMFRSTTKRTVARSCQRLQLAASA
jgi:phosphoribosylformylglycinamidine synthase